MPRKKTQKVHVPVEDTPPSDASFEVPVTVEPKRLPKVEGVQVVEIMTSGHKPGRLLCRFADGTTRHVDGSLLK